MGSLDPSLIRRRVNYLDPSGVKCRNDHRISRIIYLVDVVEFIKLWASFAPKDIFVDT